MIKVLLIASLIPYTVYAQCGPSNIFGTIGALSNETGYGGDVEARLDYPLYPFILAKGLKNERDFVAGGFLGWVIDTSGEPYEEYPEGNFLRTS